jgi:hypothetical protein
MSFDLSVVMPILAIIVSVAAAFFWDGQGDRSKQVERFIVSRVVSDTFETKDVSAPVSRIVIDPGTRLKPSDLRARDKREEAMSV